MPLVTMQAKGQMTVPQELREALGIDGAGDTLAAWSVRHEGVRVAVRRRNGRFSQPQAIAGRGRVRSLRFGVDSRGDTLAAFSFGRPGREGIAVRMRRR